MVSVLAGCTPQPAAPATRADGMASLDFRQVIASAKEKVFPAVVYIKCLRESHESGKKITQEAAGSGVLISADGELLTNWHVIDKATDIRCLLYDGRSFDGKLIGSDKDTDLALVKLQLPADAGKLPFATLGDSGKLKEGDFVMAMGAPWGMSRSVSMGVVSCTRRFLPEHSEYSLWLQTDAAICPGNSGGPLVNTAGEVVGINTRGIMYGGDMGFAIPSITVKRIAEQLREFGKMNWSWTGLQLQSLRDFERNVYFDGADGVIVAETDPESPARLAGILARDRIVEINGQKVSALTAEDLPALNVMLGTLEKRKPVKITVLREKDGKVTIDFAPREKGKVEGDELDCPRWDITVKTINQFDNPELYRHVKEGIFVYGVKYPGNASSVLARQDIILKIDGKEVRTLEEVKAIHAEALKNVGSNPKIRFDVLRNGLMRQLVLDFSRDFERE
jgi:serine protease Do